MTGYLTKDEYETFTKLQDKFCACREYYDKHLENENCRKEARKEAETQRLKDARAEEKEIHDRAEYERLKKKCERI